MPQENPDAVRRLARDLREDEPRSVHDQLGGFELAARALDKCRATLAGTNGDYEFNCPLDQRFFARIGINAEDFREFVATGATDDQVAQWITKNAKRPA